MEKRIESQEVVEQPQSSSAMQRDFLSEFDLALVGGGIGDTVL